MELPLVESQFLTLQDVTVAPAGLARPRRDNSKYTTGLELLLQSRVDLAAGGKALGLLLLHALALLHLLALLGLLSLPSAAKRLAVVGLVPLTEWRSVDLDNGGLGEGVGADKLVV